MTDDKLRQRVTPTDERPWYMATDTANGLRTAVLSPPALGVALVLLMICLSLLFVAALPLWLKLSGETLGLSALAWGVVTLRGARERDLEEKRARALLLAPAPRRRTRR